MLKSISVAKSNLWRSRSERTTNELLKQPIVRCGYPTHPRYVTGVRCQQYLASLETIDRGNTMGVLTPEQKVKVKVRDLFKKYNVWWCTPVANAYGKAGIPDFIACCNGTFFGVECKATKDNKPTALQQKNIDEITEHGGVALVIHNENLDFLEQMLMDATSA